MFVWITCLDWLRSDVGIYDVFSGNFALYCRWSRSRIHYVRRTILLGLAPSADDTSKNDGSTTTNPHGTTSSTSSSQRPPVAASSSINPSSAYLEAGSAETMSVLELELPTLVLADGHDGPSSEESVVARQVHTRNLETAKKT